MVGYIIRTIIIFLGIMFLIRILGKREVGELSTFDLVVLLIIADIGAMGIESANNLFGALIAFVILLVLQKSFSLLLLKVAKARNLIDGKGRIVILNGMILKDNLVKEKYNLDDLIMQLRIKDVLSISEVRLAILETSGELSVFLKSDFDEVILPVIVSHKVDEENLNYLGLTNEKLNKMLKDKNISVEETFYATASKSALISFITKNDIDKETKKGTKTTKKKRK